MGCPGRGPPERAPGAVLGNGPRLPAGRGPRFPVGRGRAWADVLAGVPGRAGAAPGAAAAGRTAERCLPTGDAGLAAEGVPGCAAGAAGRIGVVAGAPVAGPAGADDRVAGGTAVGGPIGAGA